MGRNADWTGLVYLGNIFQRFTGINKLLFTLFVADLLSFLGDICRHLLDDSDTLRLDLLEALRQLKQRTLIFLPRYTVDNVQPRVCEL